LGHFQFIKFHLENAVMIEQIVQILTDHAILQDAASRNIPYLLGIGIFSVSYSILALMKAERILALPVAVLSVFAGYVASAYLNASFFPVLFGTAMAASTVAGWLVNREEEQST
jgi:hypothetical protein